jgi:hypothetical protein
MTQQAQDGWFHNAGFKPDEDPLTHTIAYTIRGLLESGMLISDEQMIESARIAADALRFRQLQDGCLRGRYGPGWQSHTQWSCLTGKAQMAIIWLKLFKLTGAAEYRQAAVTSNRYLKHTQKRDSGPSGISGGIAGSFPIYEEYEPYRHLNWAGKFLADSLLLEESQKTGVDSA